MAKANSSRAATRKPTPAQVKADRTVLPKAGNWRALPTRDALEACVEHQRQSLFGAAGIIGMVERVLHSGSAVDGSIDQNTATDAWTALRAAQALIDSVAGQLHPAALLESMQIAGEAQS